MIQKIHGKLFFIPEVLCYNRKKLQSNKFFRENGGGTMRKVNVSIAGQEYTMVAEESEDYVRRCAGHVDSQVQEIIRSASLSRADAGILAAMNIADQYFREQQTSENLRRQVKDSVEEAAQLKNELSEARREIFKLQNKKA
jgi:cell division protein ZapA